MVGRRQARPTRDPRAWAAGRTGQRRSLLLREKLVEGETNPLWLSEPLSHLLSHGEGLRRPRCFYFNRKRSVCVFICVGRSVSLCVHLSLRGRASETSGRKDRSAGALRPLVFSPKGTGSQRRDGCVAPWEAIEGTGRQSLATILPACAPAAPITPLGRATPPRGLRSGSRVCCRAWPAGSL